MFRKKPVGDTRRVGDLSLDELEAIVEERRRIERARAFAEADETRRFSPITIEPGRERRKKGRRRSWRDNILFLVEVAAVLGLIGIMIAAAGNLQALNEEVAQAIRGQQTTGSDNQPVTNLAAAPIQQVGELPGSSFAPSSGDELPGSSSPPDALPASIGVNVEQAPPLPPPTIGPQSPTRIVIPAIGVDWPIVPGDGWEELKKGVGHRAGSVNPGERGNMILSGHNDVFGEVFKDLEALKNGDEILVFAGGREFKYQVRAKRIVAPTELSVLQQTREPIVTLITCIPYRVDTHRLVVIGQLIP
ncbi:MAG TPA: sortase [Anaerolineae bacterium]|nr:sortase [Anaerolineae bacterium]